MPAQFDSSRFRDRKAQKRNYQIFPVRAPVQERVITLEHFDAEPYLWRDVFEARGMMQLAGFSGQHRAMLVAELMANVHYLSDVPGDCTIQSVVRGRAIEITPATFAEFFGLSRVDQQDLRWPDISAVEHEVMAAGICDLGF